MANTPYGPVDSDVSPALLPLAAQQAVSVSTTLTPSTSLPTGTSFPGAPADGDIFVFTADATNGVKWAFQYDSSQTTYKWVCIGPVPLKSTNDAQSTTTSATYVDPTNNVSIVVPRAGDYDILLTALAENQTAAVDVFAAITVGSTPAADADSVHVFGSASQVQASGSVSKRATGLSALDTIKVQVKSNGVNTGQFNNLRLAVAPVRVI